MKNVSGIHFTIITQEDYVLSERVFRARFSKAVTIRRAQQYHTFIPDVSSPTQLNLFQVSRKSSSSSLLLLPVMKTGGLPMYWIEMRSLMK